jgi:hypothetical protein
MGKVVFSGHGGFETSTEPPWISVPSGTTLYFYSDNMKALLDSNGQTVETMSAALDSASPSQVVEAGQSCPNYTLYPPDGLDILDSPDDVEQVIVSGATTLGELLGQYSGEIYWAACRVVDLDAAGGRYLGVNDGQDELGGSDSSGYDSNALGPWLEWFATADEDDRVTEWNKLTEEQQQGARLVDETVRQWYVSHFDEGSGILTEDEIDRFVAWWATASQSEQDEAWQALTDPQKQQISDRYNN